MSTRELADWIIREKGFPAPDRHLRTAVAYRIVQALRMQEKRGGKVVRDGKRGNAIAWKLRALRRRCLFVHVDGICYIRSVDSGFRIDETGLSVSPPKPVGTSPGPPGAQNCARELYSGLAIQLQVLGGSSQ